MLVTATDVEAVVLTLVAIEIEVLELAIRSGVVVKNTVLEFDAELDETTVLFWLDVISSPAPTFDTLFGPVKELVVLVVPDTDWDGAAEDVSRLLIEDEMLDDLNKNRLKIK